MLLRLFVHLPFCAYLHSNSKPNTVVQGLKQLLNKGRNNNESRSQFWKNRDTSLNTTSKRGHEVSLTVRTIEPNKEWDLLTIRQTPFDINESKSMEIALRGADAFFL
jgi:hypothetical protein